MLLNYLIFFLKSEEDKKKVNISEIDFNPNRKMSRSLSNIGSITAIIFIFINNIRLQGIGYLIFKFNKALNIVYYSKVFFIFIYTIRSLFQTFLGVFFFGKILYIFF